MVIAPSAARRFSVACEICSVPVPDTTPIVVAALDPASSIEPLRSGPGGTLQHDLVGVDDQRLAAGVDGDRARLGERAAGPDQE